MNIVAGCQVIDTGLVNTVTTQLPTEQVAGFFLGGKLDEGMKLTTHLNLVPRLQISAATPLIPPSAFMVWAETRLHTADIIIYNHLTDRAFCPKFVVVTARLYYIHVFTANIYGK
jgi:hypothetical protein